jgi:hypothetical protein
MHSPANSDHSPCSSKTKLFHIEFSDFHVSKEDSVKPWCDQLKRQLFEAEYLADEDSAFVPADVAAIVHPSQKETLRVRELRQLAWQSDRAGVVETRWDLVVQALMRALVIEHVAKVIEAALLCAKGCRGRFRRVFLQRAIHPLVAAILLRAACLDALVQIPSFIQPSESFDSPQ